MMECHDSKVQTEQIRDSMPAGLSFDSFGSLTPAAAAAAGAGLSSETVGTRQVHHKKGPWSICPGQSTMCDHMLVHNAAWERHPTMVISECKKTACTSVSEAVVMPVYHLHVVMHSIG